MIFDMTKRQGGGGGGNETLNALISRTLTAIHTDAGSVGQNAFTSCVALVTAVLTEATSIGANGFNGCNHMTALDASKVTSIGAGAIQGSTKCATLIIRASSIPSLANANAFNNTPFKNGGTGGTIYIPKSLYDHLGDGTSLDYKAATNWSTIDGYGTITWKSIESTHTDPNAPIDLTFYYADGTPIPTA